MSKSYILSRMDWAKAYRDYEVLKVGGRNFVKGSIINEDTEVFLWDDSTYEVLGDVICFKDGNVRTGGGIAEWSNVTLQKYVEYTLSFEASSTDENYSLDYIHLMHNDGTKNQKLPDVKEGLSEDFTKYQVKFKLVEDLESYRVLIAGTGSNICVKNIKIEKSNKATHWTPNPSDINVQPYPTQVAHDMYQATEGNWVKAEEDYELLKVGKTNLLPEVGEQVRYDLTPMGHSKDIGFYTATILKSWHSNGKLIIFPNISVDKTTYTFSCDFSESEDNISVINFYDKDNNLILDKDIINTSYAGEGIFTEVYKGIIYAHKSKKFSEQFEIKDNNTVKSIRISHGMYRNMATTKDLKISNWKLERGDTSTPFTPSPQSINASPFTVKLANDYYQQQSEITELRNAILQLGGQ